jgi:glycosyltransferase involved in cell wall biosynthesis
VLSLASSPPPLTTATPLTDLSPGEIGGMSMKVVRPLRWAIRTFAPPIALAWGSATLRYTAAATLAMGTPPILGYVAIGSPSGWVRSRAQVIRYRMLVSRYRFVLAVSERTRTELIEVIGVPPERVHVVPSGIPPEYLEINRESHGDALHVLVVGSLTEEKDPLAAVEVVAGAAAASSIEVRFVGTGPLREPAQRAVARRGLNEAVEFVGPAADVKGHLAWADVLLLTSRTEGLPGVVIEAAGAGLPVVAYDVGAVDEIVEDGASGMIIADRDAAAASRALIRLGEDAALRRDQGSRARAIVAERYLLPGAAERVDRILRDQPA